MLLQWIYQNPDFKESETGIRGKSKPGDLCLYMPTENEIRWVKWAAEIEEQSGGFPSVTGVLHLRKLRSRSHWYASAEELQGRVRTPISLELFKQTSDRGGHDPGDEDRKDR